MKFRYLKPGMIFVIWKSRDSQISTVENMIDLFFIVDKNERYVWYKNMYLSSLKEPKEVGPFKDTFDYWDSDHSEMPQLYGPEMKKDVIKGVFSDIN
jgi:hypothetical protein